MAEPKFVPKEGQVDYTNIRYCPVVNSVLCHEDKVLLVQRSDDLRLYPGFWNGISGFLDDHKSVEEKVAEELRQELGLKKGDIISLERGSVLIQEAPKYKKTWIVFPVRAVIATKNVKLDWEASRYRWVSLAEAKSLDLLPGFIDVLAELFD
jgi:8-oxo-dGTP pyrophosphatase MutT (NUDIX family)